MVRPLLVTDVVKVLRCCDRGSCRRRWIALAIDGDNLFSNAGYAASRALAMIFLLLVSRVMDMRNVEPKFDKSRNVKRT